MHGALDRILAKPAGTRVERADDSVRMIALGLAGRRSEAVQELDAILQTPLIPTFGSWGTYIRAWLERRPKDMLGSLDHLSHLKIQEDPEALFLQAWMLCDVDEHERGLDLLERAVSRSYFVAPTLSASRQFDPLRGEPRFQSLLADAEAGRHLALQAFREAGGDRLLGR